MPDLTPEEIQELQNKATELEGKLKDMVPKSELERIELEKKELEGQVNPNWAKARKQLDAYKSLAKEKGIEVDEDGNIKQPQQQFDGTKIVEDAKNAASKLLIDSKLDDILSEYDDESGKMVRHFYSKLVAGEDINLNNVRKFVNQAEKAAEAEMSGGVRRVRSGSGGQGPRYIPGDGGAKKLDDSAADGLAARMGIKIKGSNQ